MNINFEFIFNQKVELIRKYLAARLKLIMIITYMKYICRCNNKSVNRFAIETVAILDDF